MLDAIYTPVFWLASAVLAVALLLTLVHSLLLRDRLLVDAPGGRRSAGLALIWALIPLATVAAIAVPTFRAMFGV